MEKKKYSNKTKVTNIKVNELDENGLFMIVNVEDKYRIGCAGNWVTKQEFNTPEEAQKYINQKPWDLIMNIAGLVAQMTIKEKETQIVENNK